MIFFKKEKTLFLLKNEIQSPTITLYFGASQAMKSETQGVIVGVIVGDHQQ